MIGTRADVGSHSDSGVELAGAPLHVETLVSIGVVACPKFVKPGQETVADAAAATGTALDDDIGIFLTDALEDIAQSHVVPDIYLTLAVGRQIGRAVVHHGRITIPLDVCNFGILGQQVVRDAEYEILHFRVAQVQNDLCSAATFG